MTNFSEPAPNMLELWKDKMHCDFEATPCPPLPNKRTKMDNGQVKYDPFIANNLNDRVWQYRFQYKYFYPENPGKEMTQASVTEAIKDLDIPAELKTMIQNLEVSKIKELAGCLIKDLEMSVNFIVPEQLNFYPYQTKAAGAEFPYRGNVKLHTIFSEMAFGGPDLGIIRYGEDAFIGMHEHTGYEMVFVLNGRYFENGVHFEPGTMILRAPGTFHSTASDTGCDIFASRYGFVKQRPDIWNPWQKGFDDVKVAKKEDGTDHVNDVL